MEKAMPEEVAEAFFSDLYGGPHHIPSKLKRFGLGWAVIFHGDLASYDGDMLTRLVFMAHDHCVRASVQSGRGGRGMIAIHPRIRAGRLMQRHPTLEEAVEQWRKFHKPIEEETE